MTENPCPRCGHFKEPGIGEVFPPLPDRPSPHTPTGDDGSAASGPADGRGGDDQ